MEAKYILDAYFFQRSKVVTLDAALRLICDVTTLEPRDNARILNGYYIC